MADNAHAETDAILADMEKHLSAIYTRAGKENQKKARDFFKQFNRLDKQHKADVQSGKWTEEQYQEWKKNKMLYSQRFNHLKEQISADLVNTNKTALNYINNQLPEVYAINYNALDGEIAGYSFELTDAETVKNLATTDKSLLPYKELDETKDIRWNTKHINAEVLQGILQGDSMDEIAKRFQKVTNMDEVAAIRNARTTVTSAENIGRLNSYKQAQKDGIRLQKEWLATNDGRTRHAHALLNGQVQGVDKPFKSKLGDIMFPADPTAHPANVYNCRCTLVSKFLGFGKDTDVSKYIETIKNSSLFDGLTDSEKEFLVNSIKTKNEKILKMISDSSDNCLVNWKNTDEGTSEYINSRITMYKKGSKTDWAETFWHEYGHYIDDEQYSKTGVRFIEKKKYKSGKVSEYTWSGTSNVAEMLGYEDAAIKDINAFLRKHNLSDKYVFKRKDKDSIPWMYKKADGSIVNEITGFESMDELNKALSGALDEITGRNKLNNFYIDKGMPEEVKWSDYFVHYETPKRHTIKKKEKFKGAEQKYQENLIAYYDKKDKFWETHDMEKLEEEKAELEKTVKAKEDAVGYVSDTFDGAAHGTFLSCVNMGGHRAEYYNMGNKRIREGSANIFSYLTTEDETMKKAYEEICPNIFDVLVEATTYGK